MMRKDVIVSFLVGVAGGVITWAITANFISGIISSVAVGIVVACILVRPLLRWRNLKNFLRSNPSGILAIYGNQQAAEKIIEECLQHAKQIDILTLRGFGLVGLKDAIVRRAVDPYRNARSIRILVLDPKSPYCERRAREIDETPATFRTGIETTIRTVMKLKETYSAWDIRLFDALPVWRLIRADSDLFVSTYPAKSDGHRAPMYHIQSGPEFSLFPAFERYFESLWENGENPSRLKISHV